MVVAIKIQTQDISNSYYEDVWTHPDFNRTLHELVFELK